MSIEEIHSASFEQVTQELSRLTENRQRLIFRGQTQVNWRLVPSYERFSKIKISPDLPYLESLLNAFRVNIYKTGDRPSEPNDRAIWLEVAQHFGVPTPFIDFTYSPFVAVFFAFNGMLDGFVPDEEVVVYALDKDQLAFDWSLAHQPSVWSGTGKNPLYEAIEDFLINTEQLFSPGFPADTLKFIHSPSSYNTRMQRQQGCFIYSTYEFQKEGYKDFEDYLAQLKEHPISGRTSPVLRKLFIKKQFVESVFNLLESMNINGSMLYMDRTGAAMDVKNSRFYNSMSGHFRDISFPAPI